MERYNRSLAKDPCFLFLGGSEEKVGALFTSITLRLLLMNLRSLLSYEDNVAKGNKCFCEVFFDLLEDVEQLMLMACREQFCHQHSQHHYWKFCSISAFKDMFMESKTLEEWSITL